MDEGLLKSFFLKINGKRIAKHMPRTLKSVINGYFYLKSDKNNKKQRTNVHDFEVNENLVDLINAG